MSADSPGTISRDEVAHLARLARLAVTDRELDLFAGQLDVILGAVARVGEVAADDIPPTSHAVPLDERLPPGRAPPRPHPGAGARRRPRRRGRPLPRAADPGGGGLMTDLTRLTAAAARRADRTRGEVSRRRGRPGPPRPDRRRRRHVHAFLHVDAEAALESAALVDAALRRRRRRPRPRWPACRSRSRTSSPPATCRPRAGRGSSRAGGRRTTPRSTARLRAAGDRDPRQDQHGRVRHGLVDRALGLRPDPQPLGPRRASRAAPAAGRRAARRGVRGAARDRHRHRRLDPPARGGDRHGRA